MDSEQARRDREDAIDTIIAEAVGEGYEGLKAVAHVIATRLAQNFGGKKTLGEIGRAHDSQGVYQFSGFGAPGAKAIEEQRKPDVREMVGRILDNALAGRTADPTNGANHYHSTGVHPAWAPKIKFHSQIGKHLFYSDRPAPRRIADPPFPRPKPANVSLYGGNVPALKVPTPDMRDADRFLGPAPGWAPGSRPPASALEPIDGRRANRAGILGRSPTDLALAAADQVASPDRQRLETLVSASLAGNRRDVQGAINALRPSDQGRIPEFVRRLPPDAKTGLARIIDRDPHLFPLDLIQAYYDGLSVDGPFRRAG